tara:strand:- start:3581 stop:6532 length:2952 start_codon:yes stop_codon:yes gene_type:complete
MASTYDKNAATIEGLSGSDRWKYLAMMSGTLERLENQKAKSADVRDKAMLESQLKMRKGAQDFNIEMQKIDAANARARLAAAAKIESTALKSVEDYATKYAKPYSRIEDAAEARGREHATPGRSRFGTVMGVLIQRATAASGMTFDKYNPKFLRTFESVVAVADPAGEFFDRDDKTGEVTGLTAKGKSLVGVHVPGDASFATQTIAGNAIETLWDDYKSLNTTFKKQTADGKAAYDKAQELKKQALGATNGSARQLALVKSYGDYMEQSFGMTFQAYNIGDMESVQKRVNSATDTSTTYRMVKGLMEKLAAETLGSGPKSSKMGEAIMRPKFQQWAKDHGFESIGTGTQDKDGEWSYIEGGDDEAAMKLYIAQRKKSKFNYGFMRNAGTGETVQVTLKDGSTLSGERAKVHSSDRPNILRIITSAGDVEFINTSEDIDGDVIILEDAPDKKGIRERIMGRRGVRQKEKTALLVEEAARDSEGLLEDAAMVGEQYILDKSGRYLSQDEYDKRGEAVLKAQRRGQAKMIEVEGKTYLYADGEVYAVSAGRGKTVKVTLVDDEALVTAVMSTKGKPLLIKDGESARYGTKADFIDGDLKLDSVINPDDEAYASLSEAAEEVLKSSVTPESLGARLTDKPEATSESRGARSSAAATTAPDAGIAEDPVEPEIEAPAKPFSRADLDKRQGKAYDKRLGELKGLIAQLPSAKDNPEQQALILQEYMTDFNLSFSKLKKGDKPTMTGVEYIAPGIVEEVEEETPAPKPVPKLVAAFEELVATADPTQKYFTRDSTGKVTAITAEGAKLEGLSGQPIKELWKAYESHKSEPVDDYVKQAREAVKVPVDFYTDPARSLGLPPTGPLKGLEKAAAISPMTDPGVFAELSKRRLADPATTSFTMGESLEVVDPATKRRKLTDLMKQRQAVRPGAIVESSKDLSKLMQVTEGEDVDVYETDEGLYMAMQKGQPLPAGRGGRLLTDIKTPPPVVTP